MKTRKELLKDLENILKDNNIDYNYTRDNNNIEFDFYHELNIKQLKDITLLDNYLETFETIYCGDIESDIPNLIETIKNTLRIIEEMEVAQ